MTTEKNSILDEIECLPNTDTSGGFIAPGAHDLKYLQLRRHYCTPF